jgi:type I restriction enzyme, S subunit
MKELSTVPKKNIRLKHLFPIQITGAWGEDPIDGEGVVCLRAADILTDKIAHSTKNLTRRSYSDHDISTKTLKKGDLIIEKSGGGEKQPVGRVIKFCLDEAALCSNFLSIFRPDVREISSNFGAYLLYSLWDCREVERHIKQTTGIQNLDSSSYLDVQISLPPIDFQRIAVDYLDRETTEIDALVAEKEHMLALIEEKRKSLISHAVIRGINPNTLLKSSGLDWLGDIPQHWSIKKIKFLIQNLEQGSSPQASNIPAEPDELGILKLSAISKGEFFRHENKALQQADTEVIHAHSLRKGDVLITRGNTPQLVGDVCTVPQDEPNLLLPDLIYRLTVRESEIVPEFLSAFLITPQARSQIQADARGSSGSMVKISQGHVLDWYIPLPPKLEQQAIVDAIESERKKTKELANILIDSIALLKERRSALITAAVTGQIEPETMSINSEVLI